MSPVELALCRERLPWTTKGLATYAGATQAEDRALQGWNLSADLGAGMIGAAMCRPVCNHACLQCVKSPGVWGRSLHHGVTASFSASGVAWNTPTTRRGATAVRHSLTRRWRVRNRLSEIVGSAC